MANLNETNITNGLSVGGGITVDDLGIKRASSLLDFYLGPAEEIPTKSDLNNYVTPGVYDIPSGNMVSITNLPNIEGGIGPSKLFVIETSYYSYNHGTRITQILFTAAGEIFIRGSRNLPAPPDGTGLEDRWTLEDWEQIVPYSDSGWKTVSLNSTVKPYDDNEGYTPRYRKIGNLVQIKGTISPSSNDNVFGSASGAVIFTLPNGYRPSVIPVVSLFQGSSTDFFAMSINTTGSTTLSRYRDENGYVTPTTTAWMPFHFEYFVD